VERKKGIATVFRGAESLGKVQYDFILEPNGRVTGTIAHVDWLALPPMAPRVPANLMPSSICETDLHVFLRDGTAVDFFLVNTDGQIENGRRRPGKA